MKSYDVRINSDGYDEYGAQHRNKDEEIENPNLRESRFKSWPNHA